MSALVWGCPKPVRWPIVDAAGVGAHGRRALSCPPPSHCQSRPLVRVGGSGRLWAARRIVATRRGRLRHCLGPPPLAPLLVVDPLPLGPGCTS